MLATDIERILDEERARRDATSIRIGDLPSNFARHFAFHRFSLNFIALFCNVATLIVRKIFNNTIITNILDF